MKYKNTLSLLIKIGIVLFSLFFLYSELVIKKEVNQLNFDFLLESFINNSLLFLAVFLLMFINWLIESIKWRYMISKIEKIDLIISLKAVFTGITVSLFTPNRVGEYGGRVFYLQKSDRIKGVLITFIGSMSQLIITIVFGSLAFLILLPEIIKEESDFFSNSSLIDSCFPIIIIANILLLYIFYNLSLFLKIFKRFSFYERYDEYFKVFLIFSKKEMTNILFLSLSRYIVFSLQFLLLLYCFDVSLIFYKSLFLIMLSFLIVSIIPTVAIAEIGVRGSVAILLFSYFAVNPISVFSATISLWLINLVVPSIIGLFFVSSLKFFRK